MKPFYCSQSEKALTDEGNLKRHERAHTGEKQIDIKQDKLFEYPQSEKAFTDEGKLKVH